MLQVKSLSVGPIVGEATSKHLRVLGRGETSPSVGVIRLGEKSDLSDAQPQFVKMDRDWDFTGVAIFSNLISETTYYYQYGWVEADFSTTPFPVAWNDIPTYSIKILSEDDSKSSAIILGSCRYLLRLQATGIGGSVEDQFNFKEKGDKTFGAILQGHVNQNLVTQTIMCGDQIYADDANLLFPAEKLEHYNLRYRVAFSQPFIRELMARVPTFMILDDHEIEDNWPSQATPQDVLGKYVYALNAYYSYQTQQSPLLAVDNNQLQGTPTKFWYSYRDACADFFVMDTRTERQIPPTRIISLQQMDALKNWLCDGSGRVKCVVSPVPLFPNYKNGDDQWGEFVEQRNQVIDFIATKKIEKVVFLSGDIHNSYTSILEGNGSKIIQVISSPFYWPYPTAEPEDYNLNGTMPGNDSYTIATPSQFITDNNFTRVNISPEGLEVSVYNQDGTRLDYNCFSFALSNRKLILHSLYCQKTEDIIGGDECRLDIKIDGHLQQLRKDMKKGHTWSLNQTLYFNQTVEIDLFDEDSPDPDDLLGQLTVNAGNLVQNETYKFTEDGANYTLTYTVTNNRN
jgi:alkaline phosphatase D